MNPYKNGKILAIYYCIYYIHIYNIITFLTLLHVFYIVITIILTFTEVFVDS